MITFPNAKINLGLNIVEKRPDGYHNLETIFYPINLQDALEVTRRENNDKEYTLHISGSPLEGEPEDNLVVKAYKLLKKDYPGLLPVEIKPVRPAVSLKEVVKQPIETWKSSMKNDFEDSVFKKFPEIAAIKDELYDLGAVYAAMSGSGSSVYGIFEAPIENVEDKFCGCFCRQRALE